MSTTPSDRTSSAMLNLQKEVLDVYEQASRAWFDRVKSEVNLWSALARKLSATRGGSRYLSEVYGGADGNGC